MITCLVMGLYTYSQFKRHGIRLGFIKTQNICYKQFWHDFMPNLSIIDVIMFNSKEDIQKMLQQYSILWEDEVAEAVEQ